MVLESLLFSVLAEMADMDLGARFFVYLSARYLATAFRSASCSLMVTDDVQELKMRG